MPFWSRHNSESPRPPLAGRLVGLAIGVLALSIAAYVALDVVKLLIPVVVPLIAFLGVYSFMFGRRHK